jgi:hypothetical protein
MLYTKEEFNSNDGMLTKVWGPCMWFFLHTISFNYPLNPTQIQKEKYKDFIMNLKYVLPCKHCRTNLTNNLKKKPITMEIMKNRDNFSKYIYGLHEDVNRLLKKKNNLTYKMVRNKFENYRARCLNKTKKEHGCTNPIKGTKYKCKLKITPLHSKSRKVI